MSLNFILIIQLAELYIALTDSNEDEIVANMKKMKIVTKKNTKQNLVILAKLLLDSCSIPGNQQIV